MPELPEVETIVRALEPELVGRKVLSLELLHPRVYRNSDHDRMIEVLDGAVIDKIWRRGKYIVFDLSPDRPQLVVHLRMSGSLQISNKFYENKHLRAVFEISGGMYLNFIDIRTFGILFLLEGEMPAGFRNLGVEPLSSGFTARSFSAMLDGRSSNIKALLLRQDLLAGIGNIYASEALFYAGIHPARSGDSLTIKEISGLHRSIRRILRDAIAQMGTTFSDFRKPDGSSGSFKNNLMVYGRKDLPCFNCGSLLKKMVQNGRSTFYCSQCQH